MSALLLPAPVAPFGVSVEFCAATGNGKARTIVNKTWGTQRFMRSAPFMMDEIDQLRVGCRAQTPSGIRTSLALEKASNLLTAIVFQ
jgi:hypothetical protein